MNKLKMAHDHMMAMISAGCHDGNELLMRSWEYADAMQAEADKREKQKQDKLKQDQQNHHDELVSIGLEECQPDWSQAPDWANWWAMDGFSYSANWYRYEPVIDSESEDEDEWNIGIKAGETTYLKAPSFNYKGDWRKSLRKRPQ